MGDTIIFYSDAFVSVPGMQSELYRLNVLTGAVHPLNLGRRLRSVCLRCAYSCVHACARVRLFVHVFDRTLSRRCRTHFACAKPSLGRTDVARPRPKRCHVLRRDGF
jgi:hypothetical protein